jgi:hypothetical protein
MGLSKTFGYGLLRAASGVTDNASSASISRILQIFIAFMTSLLSFELGLAKLLARQRERDIANLICLHLPTIQV